MGFFCDCSQAECCADWETAELIDKLMAFFPRKRNSIVAAQTRAGQLIKGPNRYYWTEIIVLDGKTSRCSQGEAGW